MLFFEKIKNYLSLIKFSHTLFAMPFAIIGFFMGLKDSNNTINFKFLFLIVLCMVFARNAAMAFNRFVDRHYDLLNPRTMNREIPAKKIKNIAVLVFIILNSIFFIVTTFFINKLCFLLSPLALIAVLGYSYTKRFTFFSHFFLGLALSLAPIGAYIAVCNRFDIIPVLLSFSVLFWVSGFDVIYALQDMEFDKKSNLKSIPARVGFVKAKFSSIFIHSLSLILLIIIGVLLKPESYFYYTGLFLFFVLILFQHIIIGKYGLKKINTAFFTLNGIASILFAIFTCIELYFF